jgi:hypothetical protein
LHYIYIRIERLNLGAQKLLIPDASFKAVDIQLDEVDLGCTQGSAQRSQQGDPLLEQIQ